MLKKKRLFVFFALIFVTLCVFGQKECYEINVTKGDEFYASLQYYEAAEKYMEALKCGYESENNNLRKRIENATNCGMIQYQAERHYSDSNYTKAKERYEELYKLNPNDTFAKERIAICQAAEERKIAEQKEKEEQRKIEEEKKRIQQRCGRNNYTIH